MWVAPRTDVAGSARPSHARGIGASKVNEVAPKNIHRLRQIRDAADNMPAVNAIKVLEQIGDPKLLIFQCRLFSMTR
jgi:hypothetical protein